MAQIQTSKPYTITVHNLDTPLVDRIAEILGKYGIECYLFGDYMVDGQEVTELYCKDAEKVKQIVRQDRELANLIRRAEELENRLIRRYYGE